MGFTFVFVLRFALLFIFWILLSGKYDAFHLLLGALSAALVSWLSVLLVSAARAESSPLKALLYLLRGSLYALWLLPRIVMAALHVSYLVLHPRLPIRPKLVQYKSRLRGETARVILANSITLTPGTITVDMVGRELTVHALDDSSLSDLLSGRFERKISWIYGDKV